MHASAAPVLATTERVKTCVSWLGLGCASTALLLGVELFVRAPEAASLESLAYLSMLALAATLATGALVGGAHALRLLGARRPLRAALLMWALLGVIVVPAVISASGALTAGAWISSLPHVRWLRVGLALLLWCSWQLLWLWHAFGVSHGLRELILRRLRASALPAWLPECAFVLAGLGVLAAMLVAIPGVLRPYSEIARALLFPGVLIGNTLAFGLWRLQPTAAFRAAQVVLYACIGCALLRPASADRFAGARAAALEGEGFSSFIDALVNPQPDDLGRLDFSRVLAGNCLKSARKEPRLALSDAQRSNVILLSVDALRRDALGKRFGKRAVAPHLEAFARESLFFDHATTAAPITLMSLASAMTGRTQNQLLWLSEKPANVLALTRKLLPVQRLFFPAWSIFKRPAFRAVVSAGASVRHLSSKSDKAQIFIDALEQARVQGQRGFFWLHLASPHLPYTRRAGFDFGDSPAARYYSEVAHDDAVLGRVLDYLRGAGWLENSLIVIFSDHGEALGENGRYYGHGTSMVGRFTDVPLLVRYPGVSPAVSSAPVILTQIAPTILHYLDRPIPRGVAACSLLRSGAELAGCLPPISLIHGVPTETFKHVLAYPVRSLGDARHRQDELVAWRRFTPSIAAISSDFRYIRNLKTGAEHLYRFPDHSNEREDLASSEPARLREMRAQVQRFELDEVQRIACQIREQREHGKADTRSKLRKHR